MSEPRTPEAIVLFEVYERSGALLVVTSDGSAAREACLWSEGDRMFSRAWSTAAEPTAFLGPAPPAEAAQEVER